MEPSEVLRSTMVRGIPRDSRNIFKSVSTLTILAYKSGASLRRPVEKHTIMKWRSMSANPTTLPMSPQRFDGEHKVRCPNRHCKNPVRRERRRGLTRSAVPKLTVASAGALSWSSSLSEGVWRFRKVEGVHGVLSLGKCSPAHCRTFALPASAVSRRAPRRQRQPGSGTAVPPNQRRSHRQDVTLEGLRLCRHASPDPAQRPADAPTYRRSEPFREVPRAGADWKGRL